MERRSDHLRIRTADPGIAGKRAFRAIRVEHRRRRMGLQPFGRPGSCRRYPDAGEGKESARRHGDEREGHRY